MAHFVYFVVFAILAFINLANCHSLNFTTPCEKKPFRRYELYCISDHGLLEDLDVCTYKTAGVLTDTGEVNVDTFKSIIQPFVGSNKQHEANKYIEALRNCTQTVGSAKTPEAALKVLNQCQTQQLLKQVLCDESE